MLAFGVVQRVREARGPEAVALPGSLKEAAGRRLVGTAVDDVALRQEPGYRETIVGQFSTLTPENAMKWAVLEPVRGDVDWGGADRLVEFAEERGMEVRGHPLVWFGQLPQWVEALRGPEVQRVMREHIRSVVERYRGRVRTWDVAYRAVLRALRRR